MRDMIVQIGKKLRKLDTEQTGFLTFEQFEEFLKLYRLDDKFKDKNKKLCFEMFILKSKQRLKKLRKEKYKEEKSGKKSTEKDDTNKSKTDENTTNTDKNRNDSNENKTDTVDDNYLGFTIEKAEKMSSKQLGIIAGAHPTEIMLDLMVQAITATFEKSPSIGMRRAIFRTCTKAIKV